MQPAGLLHSTITAAPAEWPPRPPVRAVVFDVVGTLVEPDPPVAVAYRQAGLRHGIDLDVATIRGRFGEAWRRQEGLDAAGDPPFATSPSREEDRWRRIVIDVFDRSPGAEGVFQDLWEHFGRGDSWRPTAWGERLVADAREAGVEVALASNFDERLFRVAREVEPLKHFRHVFASSELGWRKPAVEFFRAVEARMGLAPAELLLVGDDPELDLEAATRAGWRARGLV
jgi:putative hydrolase of the HAD superfamily